MRLFGAVSLLVAAMSYLLTLTRGNIPFRIPLTDFEAIGVAVTLGAAGLVAVLGTMRSGDR